MSEYKKILKEMYDHKTDITHIISDENLQTLKGLVDTYNLTIRKLEDDIASIFEPISKNMDSYTKDELEKLVEVLPNDGFYRSEIRTFMYKKFGR